MLNYFTFIKLILSKYDHNYYIYHLDLTNLAAYFMLVNINMLCYTIITSSIDHTRRLSLNNIIALPIKNIWLNRIHQIGKK